MHLKQLQKDKLRIAKMFYDLEILKEVDFNFDFFTDYNFTLQVNNNKIIKGYLDRRSCCESSRIK